MGLRGAVLIANPIEADKEVPASIMEESIQKALATANARGIKGKEVTPFLLSYIAENTKGESLDANISLIKNNAAVAAQIAVALQ